MCVLLFLNYSQATGWKNLLRQAGSLSVKCLRGRYFLRLGGDTRLKLGRPLFEWNTVSRVSVIRTGEACRPSALFSLKMWRKKEIFAFLICFYTFYFFFNRLPWCFITFSELKQTDASFRFGVSEPWWFFGKPVHPKGAATPGQSVRTVPKPECTSSLGLCSCWPSPHCTGVTTPSLHTSSRCTTTPLGTTVDRTTQRTWLSL